MGKTSRDEEPSLIPTVREEEARLLAVMDEARSQARQLVEQARSESEQRIEAEKCKLPELARQARELGLVDARASAQAIRDSCQGEASSLEQAAGENSSAAVSLILSMILPRAGA